MAGLSLVATWNEPFSLKGEELSFVVSISSDSNLIPNVVRVNTTKYVFSDIIGEMECAEYMFTVFSTNGYSMSWSSVSEWKHFPTGTCVI